MEYQNIRQGPIEMMDAYAARFRKVINKAEIGNLLPAQMQVMDFVAGLRSELAIITKDGPIITFKFYLSCNLIVSLINLIVP